MLLLMPVVIGSVGGRVLDSERVVAHEVWAFVSMLLACARLLLCVANVVGVVGVVDVGLGRGGVGGGDCGWRWFPLAVAFEGRDAGARGSASAWAVGRGRRARIAVARS